MSCAEQTRPMGPQPKVAQMLKVSDLFKPHTKDWDLEKIEQVLPFHKEQIITLKSSMLGALDKLKWLKHTSRDYSTKKPVTM